MVACVINVAFRGENQFSVNIKAGNHLLSIDSKLAQLN